MRRTDFGVGLDALLEEKAWLNTQLKSIDTHTKVERNSHSQIELLNCITWRVKKGHFGPRPDCHFRAAILRALVIGSHPSARAVVMCGLNGWVCSNSWACLGCARHRAGKLCKQVGIPEVRLWTLTVTDVSRTYGREEFAVHEIRESWKHLLALVKSTVKSGLVAGAAIIKDVSLSIKGGAIEFQSHIHAVIGTRTDRGNPGDHWRQSGLNVKCKLLEPGTLLKWIQYSISPIKDLAKLSRSVSRDVLTEAFSDLDEMVDSVHRATLYGLFRLSHKL